MLRLEYKSIVCFMIVLTMFIVVPGYGSEIKPLQGTDILEVISDNIDSCAIEIKNEEYSKAEEVLEHTSKLWRDFQMHHNKMFSGEIEELEQLPGFFSDVSEALDKTHSYVGVNEFDEALTSLELLKRLLPELIETIDLPVLLDFTGPKCKACKTMKARLPNIASDYKGKARIVFVDANKEKGLIKEYKIMLIPTLVFIARSGKEVDRHIGEMEERTIRAKLDELMAE